MSAWPRLPPPPAAAWRLPSRLLHVMHVVNPLFVGRMMRSLAPFMIDRCNALISSLANSAIAKLPRVAGPLSTLSPALAGSWRHAFHCCAPPGAPGAPARRPGAPAPTARELAGAGVSRGARARASVEAQGPVSERHEQHLPGGARGALPLQS